MRILLIKPGAIGDLLQLSPVIRALKERMPQARISLLVGSAASVDLFRYNPLVDEILIFDKRGVHRSWRAFARLWGELRQRRFDLVVNFQRSNLKAWLLATAALPCRVLVYHRAKNRIVHAVENHLETVAELGIDPRAADHRLELHTGEADERWADELIERESLTGRQLVALNLGASHPVNRWPVEHFAALAGRLNRELSSAVLLVGGGQDRELADAVAARVAAPVIDLVGRTSLLQLGAVLRRSAVLVSGDTGPMHVATAVGTRVIALFGAADPARTGPVGEGHLVLCARGVGCVPCRSRKCTNTRYLQCMEEITVDQVFDAVSHMLAAGSFGGSGGCGSAGENCVGSDKTSML
ncbi:glycosyltransferase family 9 protein [Geobacter sp.]|uniref:glycosyltransferase family 9 protein n=1 Tax=Geobacter sp. TaxID=46610 RepID=UPI0026175782|nr:glycosyltransferase family 9 protein [Geobacter sp.]